MQYFTWSEIREEIKRKHALETDFSIDESELIEIVNRAINKVESRVIQLQQDYFLNKTTINITKDQLEYDLPSDIYASKIRRIFYKTKDAYKPLRFYSAKNLDDMEDPTKHRYLIVNSPSGRKIELNKAPSDASLTVYYTRNANRFTVAGGENQVCDIPEFVDAVKAHMSYQLEMKSQTPMAQLAKADFVELLADLTSTLATGINDEDNEIQPDMSFHNDHV